MINLIRMYPGRVAILAAALFPFDFCITTAFTFLPKTLQEVHGYAPGQVTVLFIAGGMFGIMGSVLAGSLADRFGRKPVMTIAMIVNGLSMVGFYNASGVAIPVLWIVTVFTILATSALFKVIGAELFPTSYRSTASGVRMLVGTLGGIAGLAIEGTLYTWTGSHSEAITWMALALIIPPIVVTLLLPETASRELEEIAPER
jgi:predicted MFS family arabinose efflux permease